MQSRVKGWAAIIIALALPLAARAQSFTPSDVFWAGSFTPSQLLNVTGGGNFAGAVPLATLAHRSIGQMAWSHDRSTLYITLFELNRVDAVTATGAQSIFATGLSGPTGLLATKDHRLLVANFASSTVLDITAGGDFSAATPFASSLSGPRNMVQLEDERILVAAQSGGRVFDITAGGDFSGNPGFASGLSGPLDLVQNAVGRIFVSEGSASQVTDITAGGDFTGVAPFASGRQFAGLAIDGEGRLLANTVVGSSAYDITAGGNFNMTAPWAFNLPFAETALDTVPARGCGDGTLDVDEQCDDGNLAAGDCCSATCQYEPAGGPCPDEGQACTVDHCNATGVCTHVAGNGGATCRPIAGSCDVAETCDGVSSTCPPDVVKLNTTPCRAAAGICDIAETCDGVAPTCPSDAVQPSTMGCRAATDLCDAAENCDGSSPLCPPDGVRSNGSECRHGVDLCDASELCNGVSKSCPPDVLAAPGTECRPAAGPCDAAEICDGVSSGCPANIILPDGTDCSDGAFCNGVEQCAAGVCAGGPAPCGGFCDESGNACVSGCPPQPQLCRSAGKSLLLLRNTGSETKDKLIWKWIKGAATTLSEIGDPTASTDFALCFYAGTPPFLIAGGEVALPADATRWTPQRTIGFKYKDPAASADGILKGKLTVSDVGKSKAFLKGKGGQLPDPVLPIADADLPLTVQLVNSTSTVCWESRFNSSNVLSNDTGFFKARTP